MIRPLTTISYRTFTWFLSTNGRDVFHSQISRTGGTKLPDVIHRDGKPVDAKSHTPLGRLELLSRIGVRHPAQNDHRAGRYSPARLSLLPFRKIRFNPLLG